MRKFTTTTVSIAAGVLLLGACSNGGDTAEASGTGRSQGSSEGSAATFCTGAQALYQQFSSAGITDPTSPAMQEVFATAHALEPPAAIADDWSLILDQVEPVVTGQVDASDPVVMQQLTEDAVANAAVYERVGTYIGKTCGISSEAVPTTVLAGG
jgi:hypothetical protein